MDEDFDDDPITTIEDLAESLGRIEYTLEQMERRFTLSLFWMLLAIIAVLLFR